ncbi:MAG: FtsX-like permease family protein [Verrucomicrobiota bacterium]|jgi:putative ABC transport system permease protein
MSLFHIVLRNLRQHLLSTVITALSIALAGGLLMSIWIVKQQSQETFTRVNIGFDAVLGARGSKLQLVLNSIFHLEASPGNLNQTDYDYIRHHPTVKRSIPIAVGDNLKGFRIVGTLPQLFTDIEYAPHHTFSLSQGKLFDPNKKEAILGSFAAEQLNIKVGDTFHPFHGLAYDPRNQHPEEYTVTGILRASNTPADKVIWIPLHGLQTMGGHDPKAANDISAVLIQLRSPTSGFILDLMYNKQGNRLTFAWPIGAIVADLFGKIGWFDKVLTLIAYLVALVSAAGVLVAIYNSMAARSRDIAILRALGAHRRTILGTIVLEAATIGTLGMLAAFVFHFAIMATVGTIIRTQTGVLLNVWSCDRVMIWAPLAMISLCALGGLVPALKAYRADIASNLAPIS